MRLTLGTAIAPVLATYLAFASYGTAANSAWESYIAAHPLPSSIVASDRLLQTPGIESVQKEIKKLSATSKTARMRCPTNCNGNKPSNWTVYHDVDRLALCNRTMLLEFAIYNPLDNHRTHTSIRSCTADFDGSLRAPATPTNGSCLPTKHLIQAEASLQMAWIGARNATASADVAAAAQQMERYISQSEASCNETIAFAYSGQAALGLYAGSGIQSQGITTTVLQQLRAYVEANGVSESLLVQLCATNGRSSRFSFGIIVNTSNNLSSVQHALKTWRNGKCITEYDKEAAWQNVTFMVPTTPTRTNSTLTAVQATRGIHARAPCATILVHPNDSCTSLAADCGITPAQFTVYNPSTTLCGNLKEGQPVCCSSGTLPDTPKQNSDGTCHSYFVNLGDTCSVLAAKYGLTTALIQSFNVKTWGWMGCDDMQALGYICLSTGSPPMPAPLVNAVCGPQVPGTPTPPAGTDLSTLNGCALNACCDMWGQCGTTDEFCTPTEGPVGAPGTAAPETNGCISNCGTQIIIGQAPTVFRKIGYFEGYDSSRPCLNMPITNFDATGYTHIHLAFATITTDWNVDILEIEQQFLNFVQMTGFKKILSFGGWTFSTDLSTYYIFRRAMEAPNRDTFVANVVAFVKKYNLDGVDFDWEYPGEPDMEIIPPGTAEEGLNYFLFLNSLRSSLPAGISLSIAAPAGYWYLRGFPISAISLVVDYIIFMSYDLHGQWDYDHPYSVSGCPDGNCLQSHVNLTETLNALSMVTKAGVPSNKVVVGVTSYGRSFQMTTPGCAGPECTYTGPLSGAYGGACTQTPGYIANAEIAAIIAGTGSVQSYRDDSYSDIVVYDETQWIAYMTDDNKAIRTKIYEAYSLGGTTDWAVDLQTFEDGSSVGEDIYVPPSIWSSSNPEVNCIPPCTLILPPFPLGFTTTINWPALTTTLLVSSGTKIVTTTTTISVPIVTTTEIEWWPVFISEGDNPTATFTAVQSVMPKPFSITLGIGEAVFPPSLIPMPSNPFNTGGTGAAGSSTTSGGTSTSSTAVIIPVFYSTSHVVTIQPQATVSVSTPPPTGIPTVTYKSAKPTATCSSNCGHKNCGLFGCSSGCGIFGCGGGCGIWGCGGGCGLFGCGGGPGCPLGLCSGGCPLSKCGGLGCTTGSCGNGGCPSGDCSKCPNGKCGDVEQNKSNDCTSLETASLCTMVVSSFVPAGTTGWSTTTRTHCAITEACTVTDSTTTTTVTTSVSYPEETAAFVDSNAQLADDAALKAASSLIVSLQNEWDATRWGSMTAPSTTDDSLPTLAPHCVTSSLFNCNWIYRSVDIADCPTTTSLLPASCTDIPPKTTTNRPPATTTSPSPPTTTTLNLCYFAQYYCGLWECDSFDHAQYYWFVADGSSTCETVWGKSSWIQSTGIKSPEDTTYHFPPGSFDMPDFSGNSDCSFSPSGGDGSGSKADSYYESVSNGGEVGKVACYNHVVADMSMCYKAYKKFDITAGQGRREMVQLLTMVWDDENYHN
ncbi:hypothetical protein V490_02811 [Pseudogymnoascus sp. VKM F-3557]|nr:hypothetical protein V490_02811 [Pseudogymnoascus sp. VKM F-3557]